MKRILFILHTPPPVHGASMVGQYIKESNLINQTFNCRFINLSTSLTVDEIGKNPILKVWRYLSVLWQIFIQLSKFKPDLCYLTIAAGGPAFYKDSIAVLLIKLFGVKIVFHFHNKGVSIRQNKPFDNFLYKMIFKNAEFILLSNFLYPDIQKYVPESRVHYCPNGIPDSPLNPPKGDFYQNALKIENTKTVKILFLSNLIESKGVFVLLEACKILHEKQIPFHCTYVGSEGDITATRFKQKVQELNLANQVNYAGKKYGPEKEKAFSKADIFAFPTYYENETFGLVNLEAMQHFLPIVSTFEGGIPDVIEDGVTGFLVPQQDSQALAEKLEILIQNPALRQQMGEAGRLKYEHEFTLNKFEERLKGILMETIQ